MARSGTAEEESWPAEYSLNERQLINRLISLSNSAYYTITEPIKLRLLRLLHSDDYNSDCLWYDDAPLISVYIPTFNRSTLLLERALRSISKQTYSNIEVIVAAHGCTDETVEIVKKLAQKQRVHFGEWGSFWGPQFNTEGNKYQRQSVAFTAEVKLIEVPRSETYPPSPENHWFAGPVVPANAALDQCKGLWIARIDDDDEWMPDHLERLLRHAQYNNLEFVSSAYKTHEKIVQHDGHKIPIGGTQTWLYRSYLAAFKYNPDCWRKSHDRVNDTDLAQRFRNMGVRIGHLSEVTAKVLPRPGESTVGLEVYRAKGTAHLAFS